MQLRRVVLPLPLILAAVALTSGCVTVRPDRPAEVARTTPAADRTAGPVAVVEALPLGRLPASETPSAPAPEPPAPASAQAAQDRPPQPRAGDRAPARPVRPLRPAPAPKPRKRPPAQSKPRPGPPRTYDMAPLCEAARGTVSPSIVALCR
ncbi:hypothetical protein OG311_05520 [Streptomyces sp. NBC_01343]|uniref:hypothetical protein n=1 Tax=Streptomyces sp. NBC_01343 TaxID=2903832 RepID=UPI002E13C055|nr:hypothetical protein OG311_05520 [Streptomyces sp. NBC_01343]